MNARVLLLVLVTALFMGAWDSDQAVMQSALAKRNLQRQQLIAQANNQKDVVTAHTASPHQLTSLPVASSDHNAPTDTAVNNGELFPLPENVAEGSYQAVSQTGKSLRVHVTKDSEVSRRDFYIVDAKDGVRWYLVRIE